MDLHGESVMRVSDRNVFRGVITGITQGAVTSEVELTTEGGDRLVSVITTAAVWSLGLKLGKAAIAFFKSHWVIVVSGQSDVAFSTRNQLYGVVTALVRGAISTDVAIGLPGGSLVYAVVSNDAVEEMGLELGVSAAALIKASHVVLGVPKP